MFTGQRCRGFLPHLGHVHGHAAADCPGGWKKPALQHHSWEPGSAPQPDSRSDTQELFCVYSCMYLILPLGVSRRNLQIRARVCLNAEASSSRMFKGFPDDLMRALAQEPLTGNFHHYGVTVKVHPRAHTRAHKHWGLRCISGVSCFIWLNYLIQRDRHYNIKV